VSYGGATRDQSAVELDGAEADRTCHARADARSFAIARREELRVATGRNDVRETVADGCPHDDLLLDQHDERAGFAGNRVAEDGVVDPFEDHFPVTRIVGEYAASETSGELVDRTGSRSLGPRPRACPIREGDECSVSVPQNRETIMAGVVGRSLRCADFELHTGSPV